MENESQTGLRRERLREPRTPGEPRETEGLGNREWGRVREEGQGEAEGRRKSERVSG